MSVVYFVQVGRNGPVKIGHAGHIGKRLQSLQCGNQELLVVLATIKGGKPEERAYHAALAADRIRGEWFRPTEAVLAFAADAKRGVGLRLPMAGSRSHAAIVSAAGNVERIVKLRGLSVHAVRSWIPRNSIPAEHWNSLVEDGIASLDELASAAAKPPRATSREPQSEAA